MAYSVLMSVYHKENPDFLRQSMDSIFAQTCPTDDFVLVCDGPLTPELDSVIEDALKTHPELHPVRLEKNGGLGRALNTGLKHCKNELIARMDSDDISLPDRCERQLAVFEAHPEFDIVSGIIEEFSATPDVIDNRKIPAEHHADIVKFAQHRNPFNHPCVMYKKSAVDRAGDYQHFYLLEDYYLWVRMLHSGAIGYNIQETLLYMRSGSAMYRRRSGWKYAVSQEKLFRYMRSIGFISTGRYLYEAVTRALISLVPNSFRTWMFQKFLRHNK